MYLCDDLNLNLYISVEPLSVPDKIHPLGRYNIYVQEIDYIVNTSCIIYAENVICPVDYESALRHKKNG